MRLIDADILFKRFECSKDDNETSFTGKEVFENIEAVPTVKQNYKNYKSLESFKIIEEICTRFGLKLDLHYSRICDWNICIYNVDDSVIFDLSCVDLDYLLASVQIAIKDWLSEHKGGY